MHGYVRLFLSTLVVLSHLGHPGALNVGVSAVVVFYMLSGYVVTHLIHKYFPPGRLISFYIERFLRIYPTYLLFLLLVSLFLWTTGFSSPNLTPVKAIANLTIIPLNYYMFIDVAIIRDLSALPPAWSLGAEIQAYLLLPLIIRSVSAKWAVGLSSLLIFSAAAVGIFDADIWGYRLLPGILFIFLTGAALCKTIKTPDLVDTFDRRFPILCWIWLLVLLLGLVVTYHLQAFSGATILGFLIGLPLVIYTSKSPIRLPLDGLLGQLSYGLFLIHMPVSWAFEHFLSVPVDSKKAFVFVMFVSIMLSATANLTVEKKVWSLRQAITKQEEGVNQNPASAPRR
jgi:peptidoglycan/LPS O-acetylase OafA/YrhL